MTPGDQFLLALCAWRENRHGQAEGMHSVMSCVLNNVKASGKSIYTEVTTPKKYSSITAPEDPQLGLYPTEHDTEWITAQQLAQFAAGGNLGDTTGGATHYYACTMTTAPWWAKGMQQTAVIAGQRFLKGN